MELFRNHKPIASMASHKILFLFILLSFLNFATTETQDQSSTPFYLYSWCSNDKTIPNNSTLQINVRTLLSSLSSNAPGGNGFYNYTVPAENPSDSVFGLFMCRGDVPPQLCQHCVQNATQLLRSQCSLSIEAVIWYNECTVRYSNRSFFSTVDTMPSFDMRNAADISNQKSFMRLMFSTINKTADEAATDDKKFATRQTNISEFQNLYCLAQCTPDLSPLDCRSCLSQVIGDLPRCCEGTQGGRVLYPSCNVRYELYPFYRSTNYPDADSQFSEDPTYLNHSCPTDVTVDSTFQMYLKTLLFYLSSNATNGRKSYRDNVENTVYGLFMCRGDLPSQLCQKCVLNATHRISSVCNSLQEGIIWYSHCMLRYSNRNFFCKLEENPKTDMLSVTTSSTGSIPGQNFFTYTLSDTIVKLAEEATDADEKYATKSLKLTDLQTLYTLAQCTPDLSSDDCLTCLEDIIVNIPWLRLGSIGGRVLYPSCNLRFELFQFYRGSGEETQSPMPVNPSTPGLQGKRKVRLRTIILIIVPTIVSATLFFLGYYLVKRKARKSVKTILRENYPQRAKMLSWFERYNIIGGIARGIYYLHELSRLKIIHRDLKPSNVLLDENMIPKISDFGLARIVEINQDQGSTNRIVGTYGYMSPEYAMLGQFSEKSDVFSFGVMVLEIISGKKNLGLYEPHRVADGLLSCVWRQWRDQTPLSILDASINENYSEIEVIKCIQIGLLCVQQNPDDRPTMVAIVSYLSSHLIELPSPQEPALFLHGRKDPKALSINEMSVSQFLPR
ncbi:Cysteine-rich receptor-like protein kinase 25 isoform C [Glycine soja]|uniref:Cysteine-rich receptor-like protein kinase 25 isoform C n=1 Tax=Glycine soja TaxID=3848 RepID=A0A445GKY7_GLYSO|nr:Cysteine-rich receptor-like protein kinase 25 isoform C [Glycine soja]